MKKLLLHIKTFILLMLPLGLYILVLKKLTPNRLTDYAGIIGSDPKACVVYHDIVLVDLSQMKI